MRNARSYWSSHLAVIKTQGASTSAYAYARRHQLSLACLYYWRSKLQSGLAPPSVPVMAISSKPKSKFVAVRLTDAASDAAVDVDVAVDVTPAQF